MKLINVVAILDSVTCKDEIKLSFSGELQEFANFGDELMARLMTLINITIDSRLSIGGKLTMVTLKDPVKLVITVSKKALTTGMADQLIAFAGEAVELNAYSPNLIFGEATVGKDSAYDKLIENDATPEMPIEPDFFDSLEVGSLICEHGEGYPQPVMRVVEKTDVQVALVDHINDDGEIIPVNRLVINGDYELYETSQAREKDIAQEEESQPEASIADDDDPFRTAPREPIDTTDYQTDDSITGDALYDTVLATIEDHRFPFIKRNDSSQIYIVEELNLANNILHLGYPEAPNRKGFTISKRNLEYYCLVQPAKGSE
jgi:hypothetical protein